MIIQDQALLPLPADAKELARCLADPEWRLFSGCLYKIMIKGDDKIGADGSISYATAKPQMVSLLELGVRPTFYQFSQATLEVSMDMKLVEQLDERGQRRQGSLGLFADTASVRFERKLQRDVQVR